MFSTRIRVPATRGRPLHTPGVISMCLVGSMTSILTSHPLVEPAEIPDRHTRVGAPAHWDWDGVAKDRRSGSIRKSRPTRCPIVDEEIRGGYPALFGSRCVTTIVRRCDPVPAR